MMERNAEMPSAKKVWGKFMKHILAAPEGADFEVGLTWDKDNGWRVYQRVGDKGMAMDPMTALGLATTFDKLAVQPEWRAIATDMAGTLGALRTLANEAVQKNRDKIIPAEATAHMPAAGSA